MFSLLETMTEWRERQAYNAGMPHAEVSLSVKQAINDLTNYEFLQELDSALQHQEHQRTQR